MPNLRDLLFGYEEGTVIEPQDFAVYNTSTTTENSGFCCLWTVPSGVSYAVFELWSGGGGGGVACCCMNGGGGGGGGYGVFACTVAPGQQIRICAAGTTNCSGNTQGQCGNCSFVCSTGGGGQGTWEKKICGGRYTTVESRCNFFNNCYHCCSMCFCCGGQASGGGWSFCMPGTTGTAHATQFCQGAGKGYAGTAPFAAGGPHVSCSGSWCAGGSAYKGPFPGGGGLSAGVLEGVCCNGGMGAGGLVYVIYY